MKNKYLFIISFLALFIYLAISLPYYSGDVKNHLVWSKSIVNDGTMGFYEREFHNFAFPNYPPVAMFLFALSYKLYQGVYNLAWFLNLNLSFFPSNVIGFLEWENVEISFLKLPAIISTILTGVVMSFLLGSVKPKNKLIYISLFLFNPAIIYLSAIWGQIDVLPMFFFLSGLAFLIKDKFYLSVFFVTLALLSKQTVLIFWIIYLGLVLQKLGFTKLVQAVFITTLIFYLAYLPFHALSLTWPFELYRLNFTLVAQETSVNALNLWGALYNFKSYPDTDYFAGLTLQIWGYLIFVMIFLALSIYYFKGLIIKFFTDFKALFKSQNFKEFNEKLLLYFLNVTLIYYFFLTRMHERYFFPALVFALPLLLFGKKYWIGFVYFSILYFVNLYRGLYQPYSEELIFIVDSMIILKTLVGGYLILILFYLYHFFMLRNKSAVVD